MSPISATICRRKQRLSQKSATVAVVSPFSATVAVFGTATVALFCDSVDRALDTKSASQWEVGNKIPTSLYNSVFNPALSHCASHHITSQCKRWRLTPRDRQKKRQKTEVTDWWWCNKLIVPMHTDILRLPCRFTAIKVVHSAHHFHP